MSQPTLKFVGRDQLQSTLKGFRNDVLKRKVILSIFRKGSKPISARAKSNVSAVNAESSFKTSLANAIGFKAARKSSFNRTGVIGGTIHPIKRKLPKEYRGLGHLFNSGTPKIPAVNYMGRAESETEKANDIMMAETNKILKRYAKKNGFKVR